MWREERERQSKHEAVGIAKGKVKVTLTVNLKSPQRHTSECLWGELSERINQHAKTVTLMWVIPSHGPGS